MLKRLAQRTMLWTLLAAPTLSAQTTVFSTFGNGNTSPCCNGWAIGTSSIFNLAMATQFTYSGPTGATLNGLRFAGGGGIGDVAVEFRSGSDVSTATTLETWVVTVAGGALYSVSSVAQPVLVPGAVFWMVMKAVTLPKTYAWMQNDQGIIGAHRSYDGGATWEALAGNPSYASPAWDVQANIPNSSVPEPATVVLMGTGMLGLVALQRARRKRT